MTGQTILVVDDEVDSLRFLMLALEGAGFTVLVATSGERAIELLSRVVPDLILMDAVMPGLDGFATSLRIKADPKFAHVPLIFMTGLVEGGHVVEAFQAGAVDYVRKPVALDELLTRVRAHIANSRAMQATLIGLDATARLLMAIDLDGHLLWCPPLVGRLIAAIEPGWHPDDKSLPAALAQPLQRLLAIRDLPGAVIRFEHLSGTLEMVPVAQYRDNELLVRLNEIDPAADALRLRDALRLTHREAEVLLWVSYGKPNRVISEVLGISTRTVHKHLERVFEKLGTETRSAAAAIAIRLIGA